MLRLFCLYQVVLHTELERKLPQSWLPKVDKVELIEYPNNTKCKLGFLDFILRKWFSNPFSEDCKYICRVYDEDDGKYFLIIRDVS